MPKRAAKNSNRRSQKAARGRYGPFSAGRQYVPRNLFGGGGGGGGGGLFGGQPVAQNMGALVGSAVTRSGLLKEANHRHVINILSDSTAQLTIDATAGGVAQFNTSLVPASPNLSMQFSLDGVTLFLGGIQAFTCALPGKSTLVGMYDTYQIQKIDVIMYVSGMATENDPGAGILAVQPIIVYAPDSDDASSTNRDDLLQYSTASIVQPTTAKPLAVTIKPAASVQMYASLVSTGYGRVFSPDLNVSSSNIPHYGLKMCADLMRSTAAGTHAQITFMFRYHLLMKATR